MEKVEPFDLYRMFIGEHPPLFLLEIVVRIAIIYFFASFMLGFLGKRGRREMSPFEYLMIIALGSATGDSLFYPEVPILYALIVITVIVALETSFSYLQLKSDVLQKFFEGTPRLLVHEGTICKENLSKEHLREAELHSMLRERGVKNIGEVEYAFLEISGEVSVIRYKKGEEKDGKSTLEEISTGVL